MKGSSGRGDESRMKRREEKRRGNGVSVVSRKEWDRMAGFGNEYKLEEKKGEDWSREEVT